MGSVGTPELIVIFVVALIVLGPERLPNIARQMGKAMGEFRRMSSGFQDEIRKAIDDPAEYTPSFPSRSTGPAAATSEIGPEPPADGNGTPVARPATAADTSELPPPPDDPSRN
ncbi:MAG: sec-independent protein translocase protein TatB [Acidimicrobiaceae bacterium]|nr:sec-independent protein translocase protein TatB [Acidimicrobiaceae bacterium]